jgi:hypothetical protein
MMNMNRRTLLRGGAATLSGMLLANGTWAREQQNKVKHFIFIRLDGGATQFELWDPKPGTNNGGTTKGLKTKIPGRQFSEYLPGLTEISDKMAIIHTTSRLGEHELGTYYTGSGGFGPNPVLKHPGMCSVVGWGLYNENNDLPPVISLGGGLTAGFLGNNYDPYQAGGDFKLAVAGMYKNKVTQADSMRYEYYNVSPLAQNDDFKEEQKHESRSSRISLGISHTALDISSESEKTKEAYGKGFGEQCLKARRLLMAGVPAVHLEIGGWDMHENVFENCATRVPMVDQAVSQLVKELKAIDLFDKTMIMISGEFGRTPRINNDEGRDHYPQNTPVALISGAFNKGIAVGDSGSDGTAVNNMVPFGAVSHSVYKLMGINPKGQFEDISGRPLRYCPSDSGIDGLA